MHNDIDLSERKPKQKRVSPSGLTFFLSYNSSVSAAANEID